MKLYAIRNKNTGEIMDRWNSLANNAKIAKAGLAENGGYEIVTLRVEPTEPCEWCGDITTEGEMSRLADKMVAEEGCVALIQTVEKTLQMHDWLFCPNCGRRLE